MNKKDILFFILMGILGLFSGAFISENFGELNKLELLLFYIKLAIIAISFTSIVIYGGRYNYIIVLISIIFYFAIDNSYDPNKKNIFLNAYTFIMALFFIVYGIGTSCPNCKKWYQCNFVKKIFLKETRREGTTTIIDRGVYNHRTGQYDADVDREVSKTYITRYYKKIYQCYSCDHSWEHEVSETS